MTTITLPPDLEGPLAEEARKRGTTPERLAVEALRARFAAPDHNAPDGAPAKKPSIMAKLKAIQIQGPADFAVNFDRYASGEARVEEDLH